MHLHRLIGDYTRFDSIRILVGLNVDALIYKLEQQGLDNAYQDKEFRSLFHRTQKDFIANEDEYNQDIEDSIANLKSALESNRIQIRIVRDKSTHAKFYIFHSHPTQSHSNDTRYNGSLIVGSSNLSENGLEKNYEFNLESNSSDDIAFAKVEFENF